jgi:hypothetical protein
MQERIDFYLNGDVSSSSFAAVAQVTRLIAFGDVD